MPNVLFISYYYAPQVNPGTRRVGAFVRHLPEFGHRAAVLTTDRRGALPDDSARLVFRAADLMQLPAELVRRTRAHPAATIDLSQPVITPDSAVSRLIDRALVPDLHATWLPGAVTRGLLLLRAGTIRAIVSSSPPETNHLVALALKRASGLPWIADLRDGWMFEPLNPARLTSRWRAPIERHLERAVITGADAVVTVNDVLADDLRRRHPDRASRIYVIPNGYDAAQIDAVRPGPSHGRFRLVYTGALAWSRAGTSLDGLLAALDRLLTTRPDVAAAFELQIAGPLSDAERRQIAAYRWSASIHLLGSVPHDRALQLQADASALLLVTGPTSASVSTSKLFEYLASGRPILALTGPSAAAKLVRELDAGTVVAPDDPIAIAEALGQLYARWQHNDLAPQRHPGVARYERRSLTGELTALLDQVMTSDDKTSELGTRVR